MWIKTFLLCGLLTVSLAAEKAETKKKDDARGKRNLEYSISHTYPQPNYQNTYRLERRISNAIPPRYSSFFPGQPRPTYSFYRKNNPHSLLPPYAVQMEPLVHYSQRDPLYDSTTLQLPLHNELGKPDDLLTDNNQLSEHVYGPTKHYIDRPVYIKEPEPIIEIIIKEANTTLPPPEHVPVQIPKKKKEEVQVFYVKYKKNPNGSGKDSVIYDKPIPALSPVQGEAHNDNSREEYGTIESPPVTYAPPPTTTIRAIIKPDSETYHADSGIHVSFGGSKHNPQAEKYSHDDDIVESAPHPAVSHPQARRFPDFNNKPSFQSVAQEYKQEQRLPQPYRPFNFQPTPPARFSPQQNYPRPNSNQPPQFNQQNFQNSRPAGQQFQPNFNIPKQFQPFDQRPPQSFEVNPQNLEHRPFEQRPHPSFDRPPQSFEQRPFEHRPSGSFERPPTSFDRPPTSFDRPSASFEHRPPPSFEQRLPSFEHRPSFDQRPSQTFEHRPHQNFEQRPSQSFEQRPPPSFDRPQHNEHRPQLPHLEHRPQHNLENQRPQHPQPPQFQFPRTETHFPIHQQPPLNQAPATFNQNRPNYQTSSQVNRPIQSQNNQRRPEQHIQHQPPQQSIHQNHQHHQQEQNNAFSQHQSLPSVSSPSQNFAEQQFNLNQLRQQNQHIIPPGGELIASLPKYEQHISIPAQNPQNDHLSQDELTHQIQQQFRHAPRNSNEQLSQSNYLSTSYQKISTHPTSPITRLPVYATTPKPTTPKKYYSTYTTTTTPKPTTTQPTTTTTPKQESTTLDLKALNIQLPDEVPDDLREQLLSSGILKNAQISVLDYDKVGDIPLSALPPDQLANFYGAGGAQQLAAAGSEPKAAFLKTDGSAVDDQEVAGSENEEVKVKQPVQMKVVHYDPQTQQGQKLHDSYVKEGAKQTEPVVLNDNTYNRYLPLKVSGAQFPIPEVAELKGKYINSVVVLAPVDYNFAKQRVTRNTEQVNEEIKYVRNDALKDLLKEASAENYKKFLERENKTSTDMQSVILLVTGSAKDREIFMYDVATQSVSKLDGELSSAFVDAAESNTKKGKKEDLSNAASNLIETKVPLPEGVNIDRRHFIEDIELDTAASDLIESKIPIIDPMETDLDAQGSEQLETFVDISGLSLQSHEDLTPAASEDNHVSISSGYSKTEYQLPSQ